MARFGRALRPGRPERPGERCLCLWGLPCPADGPRIRCGVGV